MPSFGAIKLLQKRTGATRDACRAALERALDDEDKAAAIIVAEGGTDLHAAAAGPSAEAALCAPTPSVPQGVTVLRLEVGDGITFPQTGDRVSIHYKGILVDNGLEFDSSYGRGAEFSFTLGKGDVIAGWEQGLPMLSLGEKAVLTISPDLAYGAAGAGDRVPPHAALRFEVWLKDIRRGPSAAPGGGSRDQYKQAAQMMLGGKAPIPSDVDRRRAEAGYYSLGRA